MAITKAERQEAIERLREMVKPGDTLYTALKHVSSSGMYRAINVFLILPSRLDDPTRSERSVTPSWLSRRVATALGERFDDRREAVGVSGAGMDMGFHLVYNLAHTLFPDGFACLGERCPSNDHTNGQARAHKFDGPKGGPCTVYQRNWEDRDAPQICGLHAPSHPTKPQHRDGGYALRHEWL